MQVIKKENVLKKILYILIAAAMVTTNAFAICSLRSGVCEVETGQASSLQEKYIPNNLDNEKRPHTYKTESYQKLDEKLINTGSSEEINKNPNYNSDCQFGNCIPGREP